MRFLLASLLVLLAPSVAKAQTVDHPRTELIVVGGVMSGLGVVAAGLGAFSWNRESWFTERAADGADRIDHSRSYALFGAGAVLVAIGVPLLVVGARAHRTPQAALVPLVTRDTAALSFTTSF